MINNDLVTGAGKPMKLPLRSRYGGMRSSFSIKHGLWALLLICLFPMRLAAQRIVPAAEQLDEYLPLLKGKRVALLINQTSRVGNSLLADVLQKRGVNLVKIFVPEHGFRGTASAGAHISNGRDSATGLPIISLYGDNKKPKPSQLEDIDLLVYDLQDVGVRFFTYISTLQYAMEACAENGKKIMVLDRPDPNGGYVDGPILDMSLKSFVGMQPIPIVYGMTPGEYALMLKGEQWFNKAKQLDLKVMRCGSYKHNNTYELPVPPSPNLRTANAIEFYPSVCLFEGTVISVGRGTGKPFEQWGHPALQGKANDSFRPASVVGATNPPFEGKTCYGMKLEKTVVGNEPHTILLNTGFTLKWLIQAYQWFPEKDKFFNSFFEKLAGTTQLRKQIESGISEDDIRKTWEPGLTAFKKIRKKYLLYPEL